MKLLNRKQTVSALRYIADSPPQKYGGFHPQTILIAQSALKTIKELGGTSEQKNIHDTTFKGNK